MAKRQVALSSAVVLSVMSLAAQSSNVGLGNAVERIERNDVNGLRRLLKEDPSLVRRTEAGVLPTWRWTLLHTATAETSSLAIVAALIEAGAEVNVRDNEGNTPLHFAMKRISREKLPVQDYEGIIRLLLEKKADIHAVNEGGATPLHTASAFRADPSAVELLIQAGANVNRKALESYGGWTPLHGAAARNSGGIVAVLLKHGADPTARDAKGLTALQVAEQGGFGEAVKVLRTVVAATPLPVAASPVVAVPSPSIAAPAVAPRPPATGGIVQGRVLWNGRPVAGATAFVADNPLGSARYGTATTDDQGGFSISGVPEGNRVVLVQADPRVFGPSSATFTMTASQFTQDFHLCKIFQPVSPLNNESVAGRPVLRWDPYPDAVRYFAVVLSQNRSVFSRGGPQGDLAGTSVQVDVDLPPGAYQWRLFAYNSAGQMIGCASQLREFTIRP
jgi:hypothetical protein